MSACTLPTLVRKLDNEGIKIQKISSGGNHVVALDRDGVAWSWGYNNTGQLGIGNTEQQFEPCRMINNDGVVFLQCATGGSHSALSTDLGKVYTCGWGMFCGRGGGDNTLVPTIVHKMDGKAVRQVCCGRSQTAVVTDIGEIWNWGVGACGQLGHGDDDDRLEPELVVSIQNEVCCCIIARERKLNVASVQGTCKLACGSLHMCFITNQEQNQRLMKDGTPEGMDGLTARDPEGRTILQRAVTSHILSLHVV